MHLYTQLPSECLGIINISGSAVSFNPLSVAIETKNEYSASLSRQEMVRFVNWPGTSNTSTVSAQPMHFTMYLSKGPWRSSCITGYKEILILTWYRSTVLDIERLLKLSEVQGFLFKVEKVCSNIYIKLPAKKLWHCVLLLNIIPLQKLLVLVPLL